MASYLDSRSLLRNHPHPRHDVLGRRSVPPRSGRRQLRRARHRQVGDDARDRREQVALPPDHRCASPARADRGEASRQERASRSTIPRTCWSPTAAFTGSTCICRALLEPGDEVLIPDPAWPPAAGNILAARGVPVGCRLYEANGWRYDLDEVESKITPKTRVLYLNSPSNPTGGVLTRGDLERLAAIAREHNLWVISDEAYEDVVFDGEHVSIASLPGMYERTIPLYTFSKSYAMTGLRLGIRRDQGPEDPGPREEDPLLHREQRRVGRPVRRHRRARGTAGLHRGVPHRAARAARPVLQRPQRAGRRRLLGKAAGRRVLRVRAHRSGLELRRRRPWAGRRTGRCRGGWSSI